MSIEIEQISKRFGHFQALDDVRLRVDSGELIALLGPSGCGKTTLLRIIAGLERPDAGTVRFDGRDVTDDHVRDRKVGFVFQHYALFAHMTLFDNVAFGMRVKRRGERPSSDQIKAKVGQLLELVQLSDLAQRYPAQLSGGQRQRAALARALAVEPNVLLLDEPFGALDAQVRKSLRRWLRRLHDELHVTSIFVTHDQEEALDVADRVVILNRGRVEQDDAPQRVWAQPATPFVHEFLGEANCFRGTTEAGGLRVDGILLPVAVQRHGNGLPASAYVRPTDFDISAPGTASGIDATLAQARFAGAEAKLLLRTRMRSVPEIEARLPARTFADMQLREGDPVVLRPTHTQLYVDANA
ncbi:sulfate/molybdate ABC transporter ATP-binding protein [Chitinasiproducens palmae]|uniref:Sulfate transport system ATP-binding protein n=1 Tax=Chitinasiproducens palmae TaxID=1770053 RepID=A0A1H2PMV1_9BURK|nr:TOBE-like domain-containing protein [Chitinasiproducens palmae]SDV47095.1 sulfate transport system ATP-binding protein [Chitinasiproducens palmae]